jgi:murein DD-endopeptidase MepM/ murein hydrolase activator NlpD
LNRPVSPLLHDYKPTVNTKVRKSKRLQWFAVGLGLPLVGLLVLSLSSAKGTGQALVDAELLTAIPKHESSLPSIDEVLAPIELATLRRMPEMRPVPQYDSLQIEIKAGDTLDRLFRKHSLDLGNLAAIVGLPDAGKHLRLLRPGDEFRIEHDHGKLISLYRKLDLTNALLVSRGDTGFFAEIVERPIDIQKRLSYGRIESSLFESAASAGMPDKLIMNLAGIFAWDVDFVLDIRKGDDYYILYEEVYQDGKFVTSGQIVAAEFNNNGRTFLAIRYVDKDGRADYFTPDGRSVRKAFVRAPVDFTRISSSFNPRRRHPVLNTIRAHRGVDYAAPGGTPINAAGDGKIIFRGRKGGYGNAVIIQHGGNITTLYAHMSRFAGAAKLNGRVGQGDVIGFVGATGLATAPHLHYEYRLNGVHRNPRTVQLPQADPIKEEYRADFLAAAEPILNELLQYKRTQVALASD